jgi:hypothetical protein
MKKAFGKTALFGCSTAGELVSGRMLKNSLVAMAMEKDILSDVAVGVVKGIGKGAGVEKLFKDFSGHFGEKVAEMNVSEYVGIILVDGMSGAEERLMDKIGDLTNVTFIGGSAGDDMKFKKTWVYADGKVHTDAAVFALMKPAVGFDFIKTQSFNVTKKKLVATCVNEAAREVIEFNNKPAAVAYAEALGTDVKNASNFFMRNPVGLVMDGEPYVRSPQQIKGENMVFYCNVLQGMELSILDSTDIIADTKKAVDAKLKKLGGISGLINFHCILRTLELDSKGLSSDYGLIFKNIPMIGFSTYGEEFIGHINQTSTILVFKKK